MMSDAINSGLCVVKILIALVIIFLLQSCDSKFYRGNIVVEPHVWELKRIDTFYFKGISRPSAVWYNRHDRLDYVDTNHEFPYPYGIGARIMNFDRK